MAAALDPPVKHLLVDLDGTLLANKAIPLSLDFARQALGALRQYGGWRKAARVLLKIQAEFKRSSKDLTNDVRVIEIFSREMGVTADEARRILREGVLKIFPELKRHFSPAHGARDFIEWARARYPMTLATNPVWPPEVVELRVRWAGIDPAAFGTMTHIRKMNACKPRRLYYEQILGEIGRPPSECLLIGDDTKMDLPATRVGIRVFIVGDYQRVTALRHPQGKAPAWRGPYAGLRSLLEAEGTTA